MTARSCCCSPWPRPRSTRPARGLGPTRSPSRGPGCLERHWWRPPGQPRSPINRVTWWSCTPPAKKTSRRDHLAPGPRGARQARPRPSSLPSDRGPQVLDEGRNVTRLRDGVVAGPFDRAGRDAALALVEDGYLRPRCESTPSPRARGRRVFHVQPGPSPAVRRGRRHPPHLVRTFRLPLAPPRPALRTRVASLGGATRKQKQKRATGGPWRASRWPTIPPRASRHPLRVDAGLPVQLGSRQKLPARLRRAGQVIRGRRQG